MMEKNKRNVRRIYKSHTLNNLITEEIISSYDQASQPREDQINQQILNEQLKIKKIEKDHLLSKNKIIIDSDEEFDIEMEKQIPILDIEKYISILEDQKLSLKEMQIIYLYKTYEIYLKEIINTAFPNENLNDLFNYKNIIKVFTSRDIEYDSLSEHKCIEQIRCVNNNIKHSIEISNKVVNLEI